MVTATIIGIENDTQPKAYAPPQPRVSKTIPSRSGQSSINGKGITPTGIENDTHHSKANPSTTIGIENDTQPIRVAHPRNHRYWKQYPTQRESPPHTITGIENDTQHKEETPPTEE